MARKIRHSNNQATLPKHTAAMTAKANQMKGGNVATKLSKTLSKAMGKKHRAS